MANIYGPQWKEWPVYIHKRPLPACYIIRRAEKKKEGGGRFIRAHAHSAMPPYILHFLFMLMTWGSSASSRFCFPCRGTPCGVFNSFSYVIDISLLKIIRIIFLLNEKKRWFSYFWNWGRWRSLKSGLRHVREHSNNIISPHYYCYHYY